MLKAPFPYFGGKSKIAHIIWQILGQSKHYLEPFFGSGAVLLSRPNYNPKIHIETICDADGFISNVWRSLQNNPDEVAKYCDYPVNHADLSARKLSLLANEQRLLDNLISDPEWYDPKMAGYWIWASSCWIGSGLTRVGQIPHLGNGGKGVHKIGKIPHLGTGGIGVHKIGKRPHLSNGGNGIHKFNINIYDWFRQLQERLRYVRVVCGDWTRICGGDWQDINNCEAGIYFDPPYRKEKRNDNIYHKDDFNNDELETWCLERGKRNNFKIIVSGYSGEYEKLLLSGWKTYQWKANKGYQSIDNKNRFTEILFLSPHCNQITLF